MRASTTLGAAALALALLASGCDDAPDAAAASPPRALTAAATGHYCNMNVLEHAGPKGQILLRSRAEPVWFTSARDALASGEPVVVEEAGHAPRTRSRKALPNLRSGSRTSRRPRKSFHRG